MCCCCCIWVIIAICCCISCILACICSGVIPITGLGAGADTGVAGLIAGGGATGWVALGVTVVGVVVVVVGGTVEVVSVVGGGDCGGNA